MINKISNNLKLLHGLGNQNGKTKETGEDFKNTLKTFLQEVNQLQNESDETTESFIKGEITDLHQVTIAVQKARLSMELLLEIRRKMMDSYQEMMRMQM